jgi:predicted nucleotidyltransferase
LELLHNLDKVFKMDDAALQKLHRFFKREETVVAAYLFGSTAKGGLLGS